MITSAPAPAPPALLRAGSMALITAHGELDITVAPELHAVLDEALAERLPIVAVDLRDVSFVDSTIVHELIALRARCAAEGRRLLLVRGARQVHRILGLCGLIDGAGLELVDRPDELVGDDLADGWLTAA